MRDFCKGRFGPRAGYAGTGPLRPTFWALRPKPRGDFAGLVVPAPPDAGAPHEHGFAMLGAPGDFLMRRKSPKTHQEPPGSWTSGTRGRTPLDSPGFCPSGIGGVSTGSAASSQGWRGSGVNRGPIRDRSYWAGAQTAQTAQSFPNSSLYISNKYLFIKTLCSLCSKPYKWLD